MTVILWFCNQYVSYLYIVFGVPGGVFVKIKCFSDIRNCGEKTFMRFFRMWCPLSFVFDFDGKCGRMSNWKCSV